ncbi:asparaginase [Bradyrhizobium sp. LTSP885]|uniref:asparaginase n=1 Tax=Bradyrhizobium sp. LTSP885 TaxID=1619232 RepID=UPI0005CB1497|nr:asparaginase [Bradyrhizobium sp. LTSP885]
MNQTSRQSETIRILVAGTGGTIASSGEGETDVHNYKLALTAQQILAAVPSVTSLADIECAQIVNTDSFRVDNATLLTIGRKVAAFLERKDIGGIVVTHGTDTLEETAYFLHLTMRTEKPVVVVGAMRPSTALSADGPLNLYNAVLTAAHGTSPGKGVLVVANHRVFSARDVSKSHTSAIDAFRAPEVGILGEISGDYLRYFHAPVCRHTLMSEFDISRIQALPHVDILFDHQSAGSHLYRAAIEAGAKGIVVAGVGNGSLSPGAREGAAMAWEAGVAFVRSSRTASGTVAPLHTDASLGILTSGSLNPQKARIVAMLALASNMTPTGMQEALLQY